jgi:hypothetical protein
MSPSGQKRRFKFLPATSGLPPSTDISDLCVVRLAQEAKDRESCKMQHSQAAKQLLPRKLHGKIARRANHQKPVQPLAQKYFA